MCYEPHAADDHCKGSYLSCHQLNAHVDETRKVVRYCRCGFSHYLREKIANHRYHCNRATNGESEFFVYRPILSIIGVV